jgi:Ala-tRNA(Pro) deacylase
MPEVITALDTADVPYSIEHHPAVFTVEEASEHLTHPDLCANKNLFLRNRKGDKHFLITILGTKMLDLKALGEKLGEKVGFASEERLLNILKLTRGSVSPFGLLNDTQRQTTFIIDADVLSYPKVGFHPNVNTQTVILKTDDFLKFLNTRGIKWAKDNF